MNQIFIFSWPDLYKLTASKCVCVQDCVGFTMHKDIHVCNYFRNPFCGNQTLCSRHGMNTSTTNMHLKHVWFQLTLKIMFICLPWPPAMEYLCGLGMSGWNNVCLQACAQIHKHKSADIVGSFYGLGNSWVGVPVWSSSIGITMEVCTGTVPGTLTTSTLFCSTLVFVYFK